MAMIERKKTNMRILPAGVLGALLAIVVSISAILIQPFMVLSEYVKPESIQLLSVATQLIAGFVGTFVAISLVSDKRYPVAALCIGVYILILICVGLLLFDGLTSWAIPGILGSSIGALGAVLLFQRKKSIKIRRKKKRQYR